MDPTQPKAPGLASASLILGILGFFTCMLTSIPAIITGHISLSKIKQASGLLGGRGMALTGTILGYVSLVIIIPLAALTTPAVFRAMERAETAVNSANASVVHSALMAYAIDNNDQFPPDLDSLIASGHLSNPLALDYKVDRTVVSWGYYPTVAPTDYSSIILAGPLIDDTPPRRIVVFVDGSVQKLKESEAQSKAATQGITLP